MTQSQITNYIKELSFKEGFLDIGISKIIFLKEEEKYLEKWLKNGLNGEMKYMENYFDIRLNPVLLLENAKTIISLIYSYYPKEKQIENTYKISKYAYGKDYHFVIKHKLNKIIDSLKLKIGNINARAFTDSAPILERAWAKKSGLGWIGKNSNLINPKLGSFYFISEIILDIELDYTKNEIKDYCGTCSKCIDACPTKAIETPRIINSNKCISYLTIELKKIIPNHIKYKDWIFGCDICQDVCPWNKFSTFHNESEFNNNIFLDKNKEFWEELNEIEFSKIFKKTPLERAKYYGIKKNINHLKNEK